MLYDAYEVQRSLMAGASRLAGMGAGWLGNPVNPMSYGAMGPIVAAGLNVFAHASAQRGKPEFGITEVAVGRRLVAVTEEILVRKPFGQLKHFAKEGVTGQPKLLIVAPMSGHFATLLRGTVERLLPHNDVYITDWRDAKNVAVEEGRFDLDDYIDYLIEFLRTVKGDDVSEGKSGGRPHMLAVCQPSVPAYAATAIMGAAKDPARPASLTMMGGPVDTRQAPCDR